MISLHVRPATAQGDTDAVATAPIRVGPLGFGPRLAFTDIGIDSNVFNDAEDPKQDFTLKASPGLELWLRTGRGMLAVEGRVDLVYYAKYSTETSVSRAVSGTYEVPFNRFRPFVSVTSIDARERPGFEIDARVRRSENDGRAGMDLRLAGKSYLQVDYRHRQTSYAKGAVFQGQPLDQSLDRTLQSVEAVFRYKLTSMTTWVVRASGDEERFAFAASRNANSGRVSTGFDLGRFALIRGTANVGYRTMTAAEGGTTTPFRGITADVDVTYTAPTQTRLSWQASRDLEYSYDLTKPFYVQTGIALTVTQRIVGHWDVRAFGGRHHLSYRASATDRSDQVDRVGGGIGYQFAERVRIGIDAEARDRRSPLRERSYRALRVGGSVTYGY